MKFDESYEDHFLFHNEVEMYPSRSFNYHLGKVQNVQNVQLFYISWGYFECGTITVL